MPPSCLRVESRVYIAILNHRLAGAPHDPLRVAQALSPRPVAAFHFIRDGLGQAVFEGERGRVALFGVPVVPAPAERIGLAGDLGKFVIEAHGRGGGNDGEPAGVHDHVGARGGHREHVLGPGVAAVEEIEGRIGVMVQEPHQPPGVGILLLGQAGMDLEDEVVLMGFLREQVEDEVAELLLLLGVWRAAVEDGGGFLIGDRRDVNVPLVGERGLEGYRALLLIVGNPEVDEVEIVVETEDIEVVARGPARRG